MTPQERMVKVKDFLSNFGDLSNIEISQKYSHAYSLSELNDLFDDIFFCGGVSIPKSGGVERKTSKKDIKHKNYFAIDVDLRKQYALLNGCDFKDVSDETLFEQIDTIKEMLSGDPLLNQWRFINFTGNGCHVFYVGEMLNVGDGGISVEDYEDGVREVYRSWNIYTNNLWGEFNYFYADSSTANIDRILRMPYSFNNKEGNPGGRKVVRIVYHQDMKSDMVSMLSEYAKRYREFEKKINTVSYKIEDDSIKDGFMYSFVSVCDRVPIRDILDKLGIRYSGHSIYEGDRKTHGWKIWNNCVVNYSEDASDCGRAEGGCYAFVKNYLRHQERKETVSWFKSNFPEVKKWAEENSDKFKPVGLIIPEVEYDSSTLAAKLADPVFDVLGCIYKGDVATLVAEGNSGKTTFALDIVRRNETEGRKCFYLNLEFGLETTFQRRWQEMNNLNKIELSEISPEQRADLNDYVSKCLEGIHYSSEKDITLDALKERLVQLWKDGYSLVVIDTFSKIEGNMGNNAWGFQNKCMSELTDLCRRTGLAVLSIHHTNKLKKFSGSQKIYDLSKVFYTISNVPGDNSVRAYECTKDKFGCVNIGDPLYVSYSAGKYSLYQEPF